jgi:S-formylglutathione hydrolase FrmB
VALIRCDFFSDALEVGTAMTVVVPQTTTAQIGVEQTATDAELPVLYLLHGLSDDNSAWLRYSSVERYAAERGVAVVMPQVDRSFYADVPGGGRYWTFLTDELPHVVRSFFRFSTRREDTFVGGLSMGGYGALKWALRQPDRFAAAVSLSGALDVVELSRGERKPVFDRAFGGTPGPDDDLFALLERADASGVPLLYVGCGTDDELHGSNARFVTEARKRGLDVQVDDRPGGHEWALWDAMLPDVLAWLPLRR